LTDRDASATGAIAGPVGALCGLVAPECGALILGGVSTTTTKALDSFWDKINLSAWPEIGLGVFP